MPRPRISPECRHTLCASRCSRNALRHVTRATLYGNLQEKCRSPNHGTYFVRAQERLYTEISRKNAAAQIEPGTQTHTLCEPAQSKRMSKFHKSHFVRKFTCKMPQTRVSTHDQAPAFTATVRTLQCGHTVWGTLYM